MSTSLVLHRGGRQVGYDELKAVPTPEATQTWVPVPHYRVLDEAKGQLESAGFHVRREQFGLSRNDQQFFGVLDLESSIATGITLAVGLRNSIDKTLPMALIAGYRCFVCDNMALRSDLMSAVTRKHTRYGSERFKEALMKAVTALPQFVAQEGERIKTFQYKEITDETAESLILRAYEQEIISHFNVMQVLQDWRKPPFEEFEPRTLWSLENSFTGVLTNVQKKSPQRFAALSIRLQAFLAKSQATQMLAAPSPAQEVNL